MVELTSGLHLESFALGMALSLTITLSVFAIRHEILSYKKRKNLEKKLAALSKSR